jgi:hypothetical protein
MDDSISCLSAPLCSPTQCTATNMKHSEMVCLCHEYCLKVRHILGRSGEGDQTRRNHGGFRLCWYKDARSSIYSTCTRKCTNAGPCGTLSRPIELEWIRSWEVERVVTVSRDSHTVKKRIILDMVVISIDSEMKGIYMPTIWWCRRQSFMR